MSQEQLAAKFLSLKSGINSKDLNEGDLQEDDCNVLKEKANNTSDNFFLAECAGLHISQLVRKAKRLKRQRDVDFF